MSDLISRQAAIDAAEKESTRVGAYGYMDTKSIVDMLNDLPTVDPIREVVCPNCGTKTVIVYACEGSIDETD